jgi:N-formylglutamate amidohydrolase
MNPPPSAALRLLDRELEPVGDAILRGLSNTPFTVFQPKSRTAPFVFASPHSGRVYPPTFLKASRLDPLVLRRSEDAFVDELFATAPQQGAVLLCAQFPRAYVDVNRAEGELDPAMFEGLVASHGARTPRVAAGLGVVPRVVRDGVEIYRGLIPASEAAFRLEAFYRPYHAALADQVARTKAQFGTAIVVDCHSMPPVSRGYDIVVGDRHGTSAPPQLTSYIEQSLRALGFAVGRNSPYAGGHTTSLYGRPGSGLFAVQLEVNRALYLDERRMEKTSGFAVCQTRLAEFVSRLLAEPGPWRTL